MLNVGNHIKDSEKFEKILNLHPSTIPLLITSVQKIIVKFYIEFQFSNLVSQIL